MYIDGLIKETVAEATRWTFRVTMTIMTIITIICFGLGYLIGSSK